MTSGQPILADKLPERVIVVLHSYHQGFKWTDDIARGITEVLRQSEFSIDFIHEYMDIKRRWDDEYKRLFVDLLRYKYQNRRVDAIILSDNVAFDCMREYGNEIFPDVPVFFCGVNYLDPAQIADFPLYTGISEVADIAANLDLIMHLQPQIKKVAFIVDSTETGEILAGHLETQRKRLAGRLAIERLTDYTFAELEERLRNMPDDTVVLWSVFFRDSDNVFYEFDDGIKRVTKASRVPVYCLWDFSIGHGAIGGLLTSGYEEGSSVARQTLAYLAGEKISNIKVRHDPVTVPTFEWEALQKHKIPVDLLPAGAIVKGRPATIYQQYKWYVVGGITIILTLSLLSLILSYMVNRKTLQITIARDRAEAASKAKSQFLANMSHELRTPLNGVIGFTELLQQTQLADMQMNYLRNASLSARSLLGIINNILDFSKIEAGKLELNRVKTDIRSLIEQSIAAVRYSADKKNLELKAELPENLPRCIITDPVRMGQILINLLGNAVKFTEEGSVLLKLGFAESGDSRGAFTFSVLDTGIGISAESYRRIFEEFSQADNSATRKYGGTGLGLTITRSLVEKMGGTLKLESEPGRGTCFYFTLNEQYDVSGESDNSAQLPVSTMNREVSILIVEDVSLNMLLLKELFAKLAPAASVEGAVNGSEAISKYRNSPAKLVFMDLHMPDMDGYQASCEIRRWERENNLAPAAIIALTAGALSGEKERCLAAGMSDFVTKPVEPATLMAILQKHTV
ncbi:MAG: hypothetical protein CVV42_09160 [Candidatus Riflebacteria bacterium HGW-Riflebacteria-2]|jgi:signal transduction histidine kinase/ActR/RegA family two-component response regulator|nr:MAG: hypothetical protein CVV42_09160 [Candidatus Riflebacteria bacterium HGW-Riflebacteria-2]